MNKATLKENRVHGEPVYPVSTYRFSCGPEEPLMDLHWHDELEFLLLVEGAAAFRVDTTDFELRAGEAMFVNSGELHSGRVLGDEPVTFLAVVFGADLFGDVREKVYDRYIFPLVQRNYVVPTKIGRETAAERDIARLLRELFEANESEAPMRELTTKGLLHLCVSKLLALGGEHRRDEPADGRIERLKTVIEYIEARCEETIALRDLAGLAGMSESYFCRFFKKITAKTPVEYVNSVRIQRAAELLRRTDRKIMTIALEVGFSNLNHFNGEFKRRFGCTPSDYRKART
ncbi:AraC family transcriptional regulator [Paenibacillus sp.]|uniref:helix-turn-helix transcriptional regulator n=1 Tax=Paenibacillus sp. TaxID=58172 RepID=UPI002811C9F1|nr:AraC family transcriptional regulator [Paenibacillus sp.]